MTQPLDYRSPPPADLRPPRPLFTASSVALHGLVVLGVLALNAVLVAAAAEDRSWGALGIMILYGPIANGVLMLASLACTPLARRFSGASATFHVLTSILLPIGAAMVDGVIIFGMDLHGC